MTRPGARGIGPSLGLKHDHCVAGRAWTCGPGLIIQFARRARAGGRAWASNHIAGPGPKFQARAGPLWHGFADVDVVNAFYDLRFGIRSELQAASCGRWNAEMPPSKQVSRGVVFTAVAEERGDVTPIRHVFAAWSCVCSGPV